MLDSDVFRYITQYNRWKKNTQGTVCTPPPPPQTPSTLLLQEYVTAAAAIVRTTPVHHVAFVIEQAEVTSMAADIAVAR